MASLPWGLIGLLADGECHSGQALGGELGVSRAAVWKMIQQLESAGLHIESVKGQGYRIPHGLDLLDAERIRQAIPSSSLKYLSRLAVYPQVGSTNSTVMEPEYGSGSVVLAEQQSAGRGRRGRAWVSPLAANVYLSIRWHFTQGISSLEGLSLAVGVVIAEALESLGLKEIQLKWPNDIWLSGKKVGGVLVEVGGDVNGDCHAVIGVGMNVVMPLQASPSIDQPWADLASGGYCEGRNQLSAVLIDHLLYMLSDYQQKGFERYRDRWLPRNGLANKEVTVSGARELKGVVVGLSDNGGLVIKTELGEQVINGGEVSVRASR